LDKPLSLTGTNCLDGDLLPRAGCAVLACRLAAAQLFQLLHNHREQQQRPALPGERQETEGPQGPPSLKRTQSLPQPTPSEISVESPRRPRATTLGEK